MHRRSKHILLITVAGLIALPSIALTQSEQKPVTPHPNIIIITVDALRYDHLSCYGYRRKTSFHIDNLAAEGVRFTEAVSAAGWTCEAVPSILTGTYPPFHQIRGWSQKRNPLAKTLAQRLRQLGYYCSFFSNNISLDPVDTKTDFQQVLINANMKDHEIASRIVDSLPTKETKTPFFIYAHLMATHAPYLPPAPYNTMYLHDKFRKKPNHVPISNRTGSDDEYKGTGCIPSLSAEHGITDTEYYVSQYDGAISYVDEQVGLLIANLKNLHLYDNTLIIFTADHGEMLGEHNVYFTHSDDYEGGYDENIRVPLILRLPGSHVRDRVLGELVSSIDIAPTIMSILGLKADSYMQGKDLTALIKNPTGFNREFVLSFYEDAQWVVLRSKKWKLVRNLQFHSWQLFDLEADPQEKMNLAESRRDIFDSLKLKLDGILSKFAFVDSPVKGDDLTQEQKERMKSLGYLH